jgi:hypothetical protein
VLALAVATAHPAARHHSISAIFEPDKLIAVSGTLTKVDWVNPHIVIFIDVKNGATVENWRVSGAPPSWWRSVGVSRANFAKDLGQSVTVDVNPAQDGSRFGYLRKIKFSNGDSLEATSTQ